MSALFRDFDSGFCTPGIGCVSVPPGRGILSLWLFLVFSLVFQLRVYHGSFPPLKSRAVTWSYVTKCFVIPWICWNIPASVYNARSAHISSFLQLEDILLSLLWQYHNSSSPSGICILPSLWYTHSPLRTVLRRISYCMRLIWIWTSKPAVLNLCQRCKDICFHT